MKQGRIALRAGAVILIPIILTLLAKSLDFYKPVASIGLPLGFLAYGPFAYEAKVVWLAGALLLSLALLSPQRTPQIVLSVCAGGVLWTGYLYTRLQWTRLFAPVKFAQADAPTVLAWVEGGALLLLGVAFVLIDSLLQTRERQAERGFPQDEVDDAHHAALQASLWVVGGTILGALLLGLFYYGVRLAAGGLDLHVNPVATLLVLGAGLAVLLWFALRKRSPLEPAPP